MKGVSTICCQKSLLEVAAGYTIYNKILSQILFSIDKDDYTLSFYNKSTSKTN